MISLILQLRVRLKVPLVHVRHLVLAAHELVVVSLFQLVIPWMVMLNDWVVISPVVRADNAPPPLVAEVLVGLVQEV
jgi:hypothetical protein